jgi:uncharacterized SAM-binding protein YcdF (DUF218 family)
VSVEITKAATTAQYGGSGAAVYFGLTANEIAAFGGLIIAIIGLIVNIWYKAQHLKIAKEKAKSEED